jgi:hypothetical protein
MTTWTERNTNGDSDRDPDRGERPRNRPIDLERQMHAEIAS